MKNKILNIIFHLYSPVTDFAVILFCILLSYKLYLFLEIGKNLRYGNMETFQTAFQTAFFTVLIMKGTGVYKEESSVLNVKELKNVIKGISFSLLIFGLVLVFCNIRISRYLLFFPISSP